MLYINVTQHLKKADIDCDIIPQLIIPLWWQHARRGLILPETGSVPEIGLWSSDSEAIDGHSEYQVQHYVASDISRRYVARTEQTNKQTQRIAKQDEKQQEDIQKKRRSTQSKADQKNKQRNNRHKNIHIYDRSRKTKTMPTQKRPRASCTLLRG